jgi:hypothetical protein
MFFARELPQLVKLPAFSPSLAVNGLVDPCTDADFAVIETIINEVARVYRGAIPADCWHEPDMTASDLKGLFRESQSVS